jgi:hypothetical protein
MLSLAALEKGKDLSSGSLTLSSAARLAMVFLVVLFKTEHFSHA